MAPKTAQQVEAPEMSAAEKKRNQSNMVMSLKGAAKDPDKQAVLNLYSSLGRSSPEKGVLLQNWLKDKQCKWANSYIQTRSVNNVTVTDSLDGYGTVCQPWWSYTCRLCCLV